MATTQPTTNSSSESMQSPDSLNKDASDHVEQIHTNERVPGHPGYYEKDGLRTYGDDEDHDHEPPVSRACHYSAPEIVLTRSR